MVPAYFAQCTSAFTIGKMRCASASASALTAKVTKQPNRSIQITKPTSAAFLMLSAWEEEGEREKGDAYCLCLVRETRVVVLESGAGEVARVIPQFASHGQPPWGCIVPHWWRCLALCSDCFLIPARLLHWVCVQLLLWVCAALCVCVSFVPFVFYFHFNHNCVQLLFLLPHFFHLFSCTLSAAGKIGWLFLPSPSTFPSPLHTAHCCPFGFPVFSLSLSFPFFLLLFLWFCAGKRYMLLIYPCLAPCTHFP